MAIFRYIFLQQPYVCQANFLHSRGHKPRKLKTNNNVFPSQYLSLAFVPVSLLLWCLEHICTSWVLVNSLWSTLLKTHIFGDVQVRATAEGCLLTEAGIENLDNHISINPSPTEVDGKFAVDFSGVRIASHIICHLLFV